MGTHEAFTEEHVEMIHTVKNPFTIVVSSWEQARYFFTGLQPDSDQKGDLLIVPTKWMHLRTGDYSIEGMEDLVTVERKTISDLLQTLGGGRDRFEKEHERMSELQYATVVIESTLPDMLGKVHAHGVEPKTAFRTWLSWEQRFGVPWHWVGDRRLAEVTTFRLLEKFWERNHAVQRDGRDTSSSATPVSTETSTVAAGTAEPPF